MGITDDMERDAENTARSLPDDEKMKQISDLAMKQVALENRILEQEELLEKLQAELNEVRDRALPDLLMACNIMEIKLVTGKKVKIDRMIFASIKAENKKPCIEWLEKNDFGSLVRYKAEIDIGKGESGKRQELEKVLSDMGLVVEDKTTIHPQTLKAFVKEQLDSGSDIPQDLFGVYTINRCKIS